jgi:O-antigen ligase
MDLVFKIISPLYVLLALKNPARAFLLWLLLCPFQTRPVLEMGSLVPDLTFDRIAIFAIVVGLLLKYPVKELIALKQGSFEKWLLVFAVLITIQLPLHFRPKDSMIRFLSIFDMFIIPIIAFYIAKFFLVKSGKFDERYLQWMMTMITLASICLGLMAIYEGITIDDLFPAPESAYTIAHGGGLRQLGGFPRANGPYENPETLGVVLSLSLFVFLSMITIRKNSKTGNPLKKLIVLLSLGAVLGGLYFNMFRSIWLGATGGIFGRFVTRKESRGKIFLLGFLVLILTLFLWSQFESSDLYQRRVAQDETFLSRVGAYLYALRAFSESPLIGIGFNRLPKYIEHAMERGDVIYVDGVRGANYAHNTFLSLLAEGGIPTVAVYVLMMLSLFKMILSFLRNEQDPKEREIGICALSAFIAYGTPLLFDRTGYYSKINDVFFVIMAMLAAKEYLGVFVSAKKRN